MRRALAILLLSATLGAVVAAHAGVGAITWNREISRIVYDRCGSCHRPGGTSFSLMTYADAQPYANQIKDSVLSRRMPPWGAVKGFGQFRNDQSLSQEQIELVVRWVDGGIRRGNNPLMLPPVPTFAPPAPIPQGGSLFTGSTAVRIHGETTLTRPIVLDGIVPEQVPAGRSMRIVAVRPGGLTTPLVWLHNFDPRFPHPFLLRARLALPAGTVVRGLPPDVILSLLPAPGSDK